MLLSRSEPTKGAGYFTSGYFTSDYFTKQALPTTHLLLLRCYCHNDLSNTNLHLDSISGELRLIDFEYGGLRAWSNCPFGRAPARLLRLLRARLGGSGRLETPRREAGPLGATPLP